MTRTLLHYEPLTPSDFICGLSLWAEEGGCTGRGLCRPVSRLNIRQSKCQSQSLKVRLLLLFWLLLARRRVWEKKGANRAKMSR